eukprot:m.24155 g.24155  ORF g.24155 m.24155 type:complete len:78 (+) comp28570_c0_seq1:180-413(+)
MKTSKRPKGNPRRPTSIICTRKSFCNASSTLLVCAYGWTVVDKTIYFAETEDENGTEKIPVGMARVSRLCVVEIDRC